MNRRDFLKNSLLAAGAMYLDLPAFAQKASEEASTNEAHLKSLIELGSSKLVVGILSDIHIIDEKNVGVFEHALQYYRDKNVDAVLIAGDLADWGLDAQLELVAKTWFKYFPKDKAPDGHKVERLFILGNHDVQGHKYGYEGVKDKTEAELEKIAIAYHREKTWKHCFKEDYQPIYLKTIKGYHFIGAHWCDGGHINGLDTFLAQHKAQLQGEKPFFYFQHPHPKNTCNGPWVWGQDDGTVTQQLGEFPNCIAFSGHSHMPISDERDLWQGSFTSIGTSSLSYMCLFGARENSEVDGAKIKEPSQMPELNCSNGKQGMLMTVYEDAIKLERREFVYDQSVGDDWVISLPLSKAAPLSFENRAKKSQAPQFVSTDKVTVTRGMGKDRSGVEQKQITVHFPTVLTRHQGGVRAFDYEVQVEYSFVDVTMISATKRVFSKGCYLGEAQDEAEVTCVYGESQLPDRHPFRFVVRPCECFGKKGEAIYSDWMNK